MALNLTPNDEKYLRRAIALSAASRAEGNHPFGALLVSKDGRVLLEAHNEARTGNDATGHAERVLLTNASKTIDPAIIKTSVMYTSAEPCAMCAGAAYWVGIARVVYALSEERLKAHIGPHPENLTMHLPCRTVFAAGQRPISVTGPALEQEALLVHQGFWT
jgi:tRNA(Arg) A34 adenosine deaminase TadA